MNEALADRLRRVSTEHGHRPALTFLDADLQGRSYTFDDLLAEVDLMAARCVGAGVTPGSIVGILLRTQEEQVLHYLALIQAGAVPAILTPPNRKLHQQYYAETTARVLDMGRFSAIVTDQELPHLTATVRRPFSFDVLGHPAEGEDPMQVPENTSFIQFSSGTTGIKRGVLVTDEAVLAQLDSYAEAIELSSTDCIISWLPLYHDMGFIACLNLPLAHGVHAVMMDPIDWVSNPSLLPRAIAKYRGTLSWNPNFAFSFMAQRCQEAAVVGIDLGSVRGLVNCSEPVSLESQESFRARFRPYGLPDGVFMGCYAMAETTFALTHGRETDPGYIDTNGELPRISVGRPLPGVDLSVRSEDGKELGENLIGNIWVKSPFNFSGYHNDADATRTVFRGGWFRTGDVGYRIGREWFVVGRSNDVLIVGGVNVYPQDVEAIVGEVDGIRAGRVVAFSSFDARLQTERIVILAESDLEGAAAQSAMTEARQRLLAALQIGNFELNLVAQGQLIKSSSGKIARTPNQQHWVSSR